MCLYGSGGVHITHHLIARMLLFIFLQVVSLATVGQRATGIEVGAEHQFVRTKNLACLSHEVNTAHHNDLGIGLGSLLCQRQRVANEVGYLLNLTTCIVVSQNHGIFLLAQPAYFRCQISAFVHGFVYESFVFPQFVHCHFIIIF